jgi:hypothetical protein
MVPAGAVRSEGGKDYVLAPGMKKRSVTVAARSTDDAVVSEGLDEGDEVVLSPREEKGGDSAKAPEKGDDAAPPPEPATAEAPLPAAVSGQ